MCCHVFSYVPRVDGYRQLWHIDGAERLLAVGRESAGGIVRQLQQKTLIAAVYIVNIIQTCKSQFMPTEDTTFRGWVNYCMLYL